MDGPYEILLGRYKDHHVMGNYLSGDTPEFEYLLQILDMLTAEERTLVRVAFALYEKDASASVGDLLDLSDVMFDRVVDAIKLFRSTH